MKKRLLSMLLCLCMLISLIPALPGFAAACEHSYTAEVTLPTCAARGYTTYTCDKCGYTYIGKEVDALPHTFVNGICIVCGQKTPTVRFVCDEGVSVSVYETQDVTGAHVDNAKSAYPRNAESGKIECFGDGQVNFIVRLAPGYALESVTADDVDAYKDLKLPFETGVIGGYRLTKVSGDLTVTVRVRQPVDPNVFTVRFECDPGVSVTTYEQQSRAGAYEENASRAIARSAAGEPDVSGKGQVNFLVVADAEHRFLDIDLSPVTVFETVRFPGSLNIENGFRITGITGNLTVRVHAEPIGEQACAHAYVPKITPPTCTEAGYTTYTCKKCGESYTADETAPTGHSFCDQGFCTACGMLAHTIRFVCDPGVSVSVSRTQERLGPVDDNANVAYPRDPGTGLIVMDGTGQVNFTVNVENGFKLESVTPEPAGHFKSVRPPAQPLITNRYRLTEITGDITVTVRSSVIDPDSCDHVYEAVVTPPTCVSEGFTTYTCGVCGDSYKADVSQKIAHDYQDGRCAVCGEKRINVTINCDPGASVTVYGAQRSVGVPDSENVIHPRNAVTGLEDGSGEGQVYFTVKPAEGYQLFDISASPSDAYRSLKGPADTGAENAYRVTGIRGDCTVTVSVVKLGCEHSFSSEVTPPTCTEQGFTVYTCAKCGYSYRAEEKPALGHDYSTVVTAPTCTQKGYTTYTCDRCGDSCRADEVAALGHDYREAVTDPTCTEKGYTTYTCARCDDRRIGNETAATGHSYRTSVTVPTCTQAGYVTHTCTKCGYSYQENETPASGHDYRAVVTEPTCTGRGYTTFTCLICGDSYVDDEVPALEHDFRITVTPPTCTDKGYTTYACTRCRYGYAVNETAALGHDYTAAVTPPTCTRKGYTTYTCTRCGDRYIGDEVAPTGHSCTAAVTAPTCTQKGYTTYTCTVCGDTYNGSETPALGHRYSASATAPTCMQKGFTTYTCTACGGTYTGNETAALGHDDVTVVTLPTCTEGGFTTVTCTRCGDSRIERETAALGHDWGDGVVTKQPLDTIPGVRTYTCARCGETKTEVIQPLSHIHKFVAEVIPPTCTEEGHTLHTCKCGDSYVNERVPALGHQSTAAVTAPTCTEPGYTTYTCTRCGEVCTADETPAYGHNYKAVVTAPTCTEPGYTTYTCARCGDSYSSGEAAALGHDYRASVSAPTCLEKGCTTYTCVRCGDGYVGEETAALGHDFKASVTAPTCTEKGYTTYTCARCAEVYVGSETAPLGHEYRAKVTAPTCTEMGFTTCTCIRCGDSYRSDETEAPGHDYDTEVIAPTCTEDGYTVYTCTRCGDTFQADKCPALGHNWDGGVVTREPTQTSAGIRTLTCNRCGEKRSELIPELGHVHSYTAVVTAPTCTEKGFATLTCSCGDSYVDREVPALGHDYAAAVTAPTCTEAGCTTYTCSRCGDRYVGGATAAIGHDYRARVTAPTCTSPGFTTFICTRCGDRYVGDETPALGHDWGESAVTLAPTQTEPGERASICARCGEKRTEPIPALSHEHSYTEVITPPTCTEPGYTTHTCACGDRYTDSEIPASGHDYTAVVTAPTCTAPGYTTYTCTRCGESCRADEVAAPGHDYEASVTPPTCMEKGFTVYTCTRCGAMRIGDETAALGHDWEEGVVTAEPTETEPGERVCTCSRCGERRIERIPELSHVHAYDAVVIAPTCTVPGYTAHTCSCGRSYRDGEVPALGHAYADGVCIRCGAKDPDAAPPAVEPVQFEDVTDDSQYFYRPVFWAVENEITNGATSTTFNPGAACTRAQVVTFLWRAAGKPEPKRSTNPFEDVKDDQYYTKAILWAVENEITNGTGDGRFNPGATCTRGQIVTFLWRYFEETEPENEENPFEDVKDGQYYTKAILWAVEDAITRGTSADKFSPNSTCTRGQIVTFLYRAMTDGS